MVTTRRAGVRTTLACAAAAPLVLNACASPLHERTEGELTRATITALRAEIEDAERHPERRTTTPGTASAEDLGIRDQDLETIERDFSPASDLARLRDGASDGADPIESLLDVDLFGDKQRTVRVGLEYAVASAVENNLDTRVARFGPAIAEAELVQASAAFDWLFSTGLQWEDTDTPQVGAGFLGLGAVVSSDQTVTSTTGLSRSLTSGGTFGVNQTLLYSDVRSSGFGTVGSPNPATTAAFTFEFNQPLLRGFGSDVALAEVRLRRNAERARIAELRGRLIGTVTQVESAYWDLVQAYNELVIRSRLLDRGGEVRDNIRARRVQDARQAQIADAVATTERRRADVMRAQTALRRASDRLKALIDHPDLPVGGEVLILPADAPVDGPVSFSLADALATALTTRPEIDTAVLTIDDASIRQRVASNSRLPRLDLTAQFTLIGLDDDLGGAYGEAFENEFVDGFLLGFLFEQPVGNRAGLARDRAARLTRMRSVLEYRRTLRDIALEVKDSLDTLVLNSKLVSQARVSRIAQAEALRALQVEKRLTSAGYSVERLNLELTQQELLAQAEIAEIQALVEYNRSISALHAATGTTLSHNRIDFVVPDINQLEVGERAIDYGRSSVGAGR